MKTTRGIYSESIYLSTKNCRVLWLAAKRIGHITDEQGLSRMMTADEIADGIVSDAIPEKYPDELRFIEQQDKNERAFINTPTEAK